MGLAEPIRVAYRKRFGEDVEIAHCAQGGVPLANYEYPSKSWHPDRRNEHYDRLLEVIRKCIHGIRESGDTAEVRAMFWMQGEQDGKTGNTGPKGTSMPPLPQPAASEQYAKNLRYLIECVRRDLGAPRLPFILGDTPVGQPPDYQIDKSAHKGSPVVVRGQHEVARTVPDVVCVSTVGFERGADQLHLTERGVTQLAEAMCAALGSGEHRVAE